MESRLGGAQRAFAGGRALVLSLPSDFFHSPLPAVEIECQTRTPGSFLPLTACAPCTVARDVLARSHTSGFEPISSAQSQRSR